MATKASDCVFIYVSVVMVHTRAVRLITYEPGGFPAQPLKNVGYGLVQMRLGPLVSMALAGATLAECLDDYILNYLVNFVSKVYWGNPLV